MTRFISILPVSVLSVSSLIFPVFLIILISSSIGCRMCGTSYDYCVPAHTGRAEDYRGCDTLYRAGSIFNGDNERIADSDGQIIRATNSGNFGVTAPITRIHTTPSRLEPRSSSPIGRPSLAPTPNGNNNNNNDPENFIPEIKELLQDTTPVKPVIPTVNPPITRQTSIETIPFSAQSGEPTFTVEDLRRLDPSVTDIKILNIKDSVNAK
ncbi:MAG: hypothetical protein LBG58_03665 [Planctomycetaceae bacterium]|jgi:hypothetical protein|nr:hypothetical protein [Planctomycetaceae bacterium]